MEKQPQTTYFIYARRSSSDQSDRQVQSIDDQINFLKEFAQKRGLTIKRIFTESKSAKKPHNRPVFTDMLERIHKGEAQGILCWNINRLSRNPIDSGSLGWMLQQGILECIQTIDKQYLPSDNVLLFSLETGQANQYIISLRQDSIRGMEGKADRGWLPSRAPLGYQNDLLKHIIVEDPEYFPLVRKMWDLMLTGNYTPPQILTIANTEWGFRSPKRKRGGGVPLAKSVMYKIFTNIFYTGMFSWRGNIYKGNHKPMITLEEYDKVQVILGGRGKPRSKTHVFAYTGMMTCGECGSMMTASEKTKVIKTTGEVKTYVYYHCTKKKVGVKCSQPPATLDEVESQIADEIEKFAILPEFREWALEILNERNDGEIQDRQKVYEMQHKDLEVTQRELDSLTQMRYRDLIDDATYVRERDVLKQKIQRLQVLVDGTEDRAKRWLELTEQTFHFATYARKAFHFGTLNEKKEILAALGSNFVLKDRKLSIEASEWLVPITKTYPELQAEYKRLELASNLSTETRKDAFASLRLDWGANPVMNHTRETVERFLDRYIEITLMQSGLGPIDTTLPSPHSLPPPPTSDDSRPP